MADTFNFTGSMTTSPQGSAPSFGVSLDLEISESLSLASKQLMEMDLAADGAQAVNFGGVVNANIVVLKADGGKVVATLTSADGTAQTIPFDSYLILMSATSPFTALSLTRTPGTDTTVRILLGQQA